VTAGVSVVLCSRNGLSRGFLEEALRSVLEQSVRPAEVIVVDDGSTDGTSNWLRKNLPEVKVLANEGGGLAAARNTGIRRALQPLIALIDDDDVWLQDKLALQLAQVSACPRPEATIWVAQAVAVPNPSAFASWPACLLASPVLHSGALLPAALLRRVGPFDESLAYGSAFQYWIRCLQAGAELCFSERPLLVLRRHSAQMTAPARLLDNALAVDRLLLPLLQQVPAPLAGRIRGARLLMTWRSLARRVSRGAAIRYWAGSPLRPAPFGPRILASFLLDSAAACRPGHELGQRLRGWSLRCLLGDAWVRRCSQDGTRC
jgi:glycosyltransferase involved in cell wall biosynthesis